MPTHARQSIRIQLVFGELLGSARPDEARAKAQIKGEKSNIFAPSSETITSHTRIYSIIPCVTSLEINSSRQRAQMRWDATENLGVHVAEVGGQRGCIDAREAPLMK
jgi:hypothetical protein